MPERKSLGTGNRPDSSQGFKTRWLYDVRTLRYTLQGSHCRPKHRIRIEWDIDFLGKHLIPLVERTQADKTLAII